MLAPFTKVIVDKKVERGFRRRVLSHMPKEHVEAIWGRIHGDTLYIVAFMRMEHKAARRFVEYQESELDDHETDAQDAGLTFLGTIHSHPNTDDALFSEGDIDDAQESQESIMGICAVQTTDEHGKKLRKRICRISYWPISRPLEVFRKSRY